MSLGRGETFSTAIADELKEADILLPPHELIGLKFQFGAEWRSHHEILVGTITGIGLSDEGGLDFYVSTPQFWGARLISIKRSNGKWLAYTEDKNPDYRFYPGKFEIFPA